MHAALIEYRGKGIIIAGPSGAGKSTCCRRVPTSWRALCDDEVLVVRGDNGLYYAHPFPTWSEYFQGGSKKRTWNIGYNLPLAGFFFLNQANVDKAEPMGKGNASILIYKSSNHVFNRSWRGLKARKASEERRAAFENSCVLSKSVPAFLLKTTLNGNFWKEIEKVLEFSLI